MGLFSPRRDPRDPKQLLIAAHELGHAYAWKDAGLTVREIVHTGDGGEVTVKWDPDKGVAYLIGCWGGFEAEKRWASRYGGHASRSHSSYDISRFRYVARQLDRGERLSEGQARSKARAAIGRHWSAIVANAPRLVERGRLHL